MHTLLYLKNLFQFTVLEGSGMHTMEERIAGACAGFERRLKLQGVHIPETGIIVGRALPEKELPFGDPSVSIGWDNAHFPLGYGFILQKGIPAIIEMSEEKASLSEDADAQRKGIATVYKSLLSHISRHLEAAASLNKDNKDERLSSIAENLEPLLKGPPENFAQAVQLFWFLWRARQYAFSSCVGRMDVFLKPFYEKSVKTEEDREKALDLICELWEKMNMVASGDTLMNVMLGGVDSTGEDISSDLSVLLMEATMKTAKSEPHINIRYHKNTPDWFLNKAAQLIAMGQGQGVQYHDEAIIPALVDKGIPLELARLYANDGCTEVTIDGHSGIQFWQMEMVKTLELCLFKGEENPVRPHKKAHKWTYKRPAAYYSTQLVTGYDSGDPRQASSFQEFYEMFLKQLYFQMDNFLKRIDEKILEDKTTDITFTSLIVCGGIESSVKKGLDPLRGGFDVDNYQLLSGSIPTTADSLAGLKYAVYEKKLCTMDELIEALSTDFENNPELRKVLAGAPKFGNGEDSADGIAADIAEKFISYVEGHKSPEGVRIWPGIYNIDFNLFASVLGATPDGRHSGDMICDHFSPTPGTAKKGPTAVLRSASKAPLHRGCAASPVYITLPGGKGLCTPEVINRLTTGIRELNLPVVSIAAYDRETLEDAALHPEKHQDLIVRVWGYNARFVDLDSSLQQHIINRIL